MDWVASMHRHPWHAKNHCNVTFPEFPAREWSPMHLAGAIPCPSPPAPVMERMLGGAGLQMPVMLLLVGHASPACTKHCPHMQAGVRA